MRTPLTIALADPLAGQSQAYKIGYYVGSAVGIILILLFIRAIFKRKN